ncbi:MAG: TetR/AcrR family transcriptional regulator [Acidiferrobacterales bacterium]
MRAHSTTPAPRQDNRRQRLLDTAARLFRQHGYHATSMRDIASAVGMLPGSIYYHFASKDELLVTVYREGVSRIAERLDAAVAGKKEPWQQLEAACIAHLQTLLDHSDYAQVVIRVLPDDAPAVRVRLAALRDQYEERFKDLVAALDLPAYVDRHYLRLLLIGALNWSQVWYRRGGDSPRTIAKRFLQVLHGIQAQQR